MLLARPNDNITILAVLPEDVDLVGTPALLDHKEELGGQQHWRPLPLDAQHLLEVAHDVAKVDVEERSVGHQHDVVVVSVDSIEVQEVLQ